VKRMLMGRASINSCSANATQTQRTDGRTGAALLSLRVT
jgi:hypothetical protein